MNTEISEIVETIVSRRKKSQNKNRICKFLLMLVVVMAAVVSCGKKENVAEYEVTNVQLGDISLSVSKTGQVVSDNGCQFIRQQVKELVKYFSKKGIM